MYAMMAQWFERSAPETEQQIQLKAGILIFF